MDNNDVLEREVEIYKKLINLIEEDLLLSKNETNEK